MNSCMSHILDQCPVGTYQPANKKYCLRCEGNNISTEGSSSCTPCEAGTVANKKRNECGEFKFIKIFLKRLYLVEKLLRSRKY